MAELSQDQKEALEQQKQQCPFCKIVKGEIPSKKAFEDDKAISVLDINPLTDGHSLLMPKEHYPIMPLIPQDEFIHLFQVVREYAMAQKRAFVKSGVTVFIANGQIAGQMAAHFMIHMIPRENGDGIFNFELEGKEGVDQTEYDEIFNLCKHNLPIMMENHFKRLPAEWHTPGGMPQKFTKEKVIQIIEQNQQIKDMIIQDPEGFAKQAKTHDQLRQLFADVDITEVIKHFRPDYEPGADPDTPQPVQKAQGPASAAENAAPEEPSAKQLFERKQDIIEKIENSEKMKDTVKNDPEGFRQLIGKNEALKKMLEGIDPEEIIDHFAQGPLITSPR